MSLIRAAPGVDGVTWEQYGGNLEGNLLDLHARLHRGAYRARPSRRVYIPKADGRQRPLGIASLEDKLVQRAVVEVLNAIYEADFLGFSYGFRPQRGPHNALDALAVGILRKKVNWLLDAGGYKIEADGRFSVVPDKVKAGLESLARELLTIEATGDKARAKALLEKLAVLRPPTVAVIARLGKIPVDIAPRFVTAEQLEAEFP